MPSSGSSGPSSLEDRSEASLGQSCLSQGVHRGGNGLAVDFEFGYLKAEYI